MLFLEDQLVVFGRANHFGISRNERRLQIADCSACLMVSTSNPSTGPKHQSFRSDVRLSVLQSRQRLEGLRFGWWPGESLPMPVGSTIEDIPGSALTEDMVNDTSVLFLS